MIEKIRNFQSVNIVKKYQQNGVDVTILDEINIDFFEGEIVGILGRSGSGKSTFLRIISDLIQPSSGKMLYKNMSVREANPKTSMVFQSFGLIPWLTVFDNIALGLEEIRLSKAIIKDKVMKAISLVGLRGYEEAYPKEMSSGMRQRVGFARALVVDPEILLMDEPFSALDYLTADALKVDLLDLWFNRSLSSIKTIVLVTHSIEEAVALCDRVIVLSSNPGKIVADIPITLPHPRDLNAKNFHAMIEKLYLVMTNAKVAKLGSGAGYDLHKFYPQQKSAIHLIHFLEEIQKQFGSENIDLHILSQALNVHDESIIVFIEILTLLRFLEIDGDNVRISSTGNILLETNEDTQKIIFREHLVKHVSFISDIYRKLQNAPHTSISKSELMQMLEQKFPKRQAKKVLLATISWVRYANLFAYDDIDEVLCMDEKFSITE